MAQVLGEGMWMADMRKRQPHRGTSRRCRTTSGSCDIPTQLVSDESVGMRSDFDISARVQDNNRDHGIDTKVWLV